MFFLFKAAKWLDGKIDEPRKQRERERLQKMFHKPPPRRAGKRSQNDSEKS